MTVRPIVALAMCAAVSGCGGTSGGGMSLPPGMQSRCRVGATQTGLLVTELPAAEKSNLEARLKEGAVAVEYTGCAMRLVTECRIGGGYLWQPTTPGTDIVEIENESELYAKLPLGALSLSGELSRSGTLKVETTVVGQMRLEGTSATMVPNSHECERATHVVDGVTLGAFVLSAGQTVGQGGSVGAYGVEAGGKNTRSARVVKYAGNVEGCYGEVGDRAPADCASPIHVFLSGIPGKAEPEGRPGEVRADFVSTDEQTRWDIYVDDEATCTSPCSVWVDPSRPIALKTRNGSDKLRLGGLDPSAGPVQVVARPKSQGRLATGITFTALGGLAVITGISLTGVGCSDDDRDGMCKAGIITGVAGAVVTVGGIYLMRSALAKLKLQPIFTAGGITIEPGPGYVAGSF